MLLSFILKTREIFHCRFNDDDTLRLQIYLSRFIYINVLIVENKVYYQLCLYFERTVRKKLVLFRYFVRWCLCWVIWNLDFLIAVSKIIIPHHISMVIVDYDYYEVDCLTFYWYISIRSINFDGLDLNINVR